MSMSKAKAENRELPRRFYEQAGVAEGEDGFGVLLDGRPVKTPAKNTLQVPAEDLAQAIAHEWENQGEHIDPFTMPLTRICHVAIDRMAEARQAAAAEIARYAATDLLCYRAEDAALAERQAAAWDRYLDWSKSALDAPLKATRSLTPIAQPDASLKALETRALALDDLRLTGLVSAAPILTSAVLAFALLEEEGDAQTVFAASRLEEAFQNERWGEDPDAIEAAANKKRDLMACETLFRTLDRAGV